MFDLTLGQAWAVVIALLGVLAITVRDVGFAPGEGPVTRRLEAKDAVLHGQVLLGVAAITWFAPLIGTLAFVAVMIRAWRKALPTGD